MKIFYNEKQSAKSNESFSPSAMKPKALLNYWKELSLDFEIIKSKAISREDFYLAHDKRYVDEVLDLKKANGFNNFSKDVANSLPFTTGSILDAAIYSYENNEVSCSPTSGFHHACFSGGGGFCTFNGLMVAAIKLHHIYGLKIGIIDLDNHFGNGTQDIIDHLDINYIRHYTFGAFNINQSNSQDWLKRLPQIVSAYNDCDLVIYQAGADPHINDPLGGSLTTKEMTLRDQIVFKTLKEIDVPVVWNLAGGYQSPLKKVLELHTNTFLECQAIHHPKSSSQDLIENNTITRKSS